MDQVQGIVKKLDNILNCCEAIFQNMNCNSDDSTEILREIIDSHNECDKKRRI